MKAIPFRRYGEPESLYMDELDTPLPGPGEVVVRVQAASINSWDWELLHGTPFANRLGFGLFRPGKIKSLGCDIAGVVQEVGSAVQRLQPGDAVFGDLSADGWGGFAEYALAPESALTLKPEAVSFEEAAATPQAALLALQALRDRGALQAGEKVLINGASGGAGSFAIQLAKLYGAEVSGSCRGSKMELVRELGADHVIDYTQHDITRCDEQFDLIIDMQAHHSLFAYRRILRPGGRYYAVGGRTRYLMLLLIIGPLLSLTGRKKYGLLLHRANKGLEEMAQLLASHRIMAVIDRTYTLGESAAALRYYGDGNARGKVVIVINGSREGSDL